MNLIDVAYSVPTWVLALALVSLTTGYTVGGLMVVRRRWPWVLDAQHAAMAQVVSAIVGVVFAVILGFVAVAVWQAFDRAQSIVELEANAAGDLFRTADGPDKAFRGRIQRGLLDYVRLVIEEEWLCSSAAG